MPLRLLAFTRRRLIATALALPLLAGMVIIGDVFFAHDNFRVRSADLLRSGQLRQSQWQSTFDDTHYRSVLNLRGAKPASGWYQIEMAFAAEHGLEHHDIELSANHEPSLAQMDEIVDVLRRSQKPLLIHCKSGSDRTGLVAALYRLTVEGKPDDVAGRELSLWYGHFPWLGSRTSAMDAALAHYENVRSQTIAGMQTNKPL